MSTDTEKEQGERQARVQQAQAALKAALERARRAQGVLARAGAEGRNRALAAVLAALTNQESEILAANQFDMEQAVQQGIAAPLQKRLALTPEKLEGLRAGLRQLMALPDPLGQGGGLRVRPNGLRLETVRVPLGVIALIYESRPGVTVEASGLALKSGNAILLRGGREALASNRALVDAIRAGLVAAEFDADAVQLVPDPDRAYVEALLHLPGLDLLIPRGGPELIARVNREATVPVIETGVGNCHVYVDRAADLEMAVRIVRDAKVGNPAVCNAAETVLVHADIAPRFLPRLETALRPYGVRLHAETQARRWLNSALPADEDDFAREYLDLDLAVAVVPDLEAAIAHIERYGTKHSEAIVTDDYRAGVRFQEAVDAAVVYWNASTRFTDGFEFGLGAEVGISTQKLHARGPMGLEALTTVKTLAWGSGQTRDIP